MRTPVPESRLAHADGSDRHPPRRLRPHRRVRGRMPRRDRADRARRACHRSDPRRAAARHPRGRARPARALPFTPPGVHVAVVDPGSAARGARSRCGARDRLLVGPDNGLLMPAAEHLGGVEEAVDLASSPWRLEPVSATFHGRDVFAPVAAHLALGEPLARRRGAARRRSGSCLWRCRSRTGRACALVAHALAFDTTGTCSSTPPAATCAAGRARRGRAAAGWRAGGRSVTSRTASCCCRGLLRRARPGGQRGLGARRAARPAARRRGAPHCA